jgi:hypothetical protein
MLLLQCLNYSSWNVADEYEVQQPQIELDLLHPFGDMTALPAPSPTHLLRSHRHPVASLFVSADNERLYSGDADGLVVVTSTRSIRALASWNAHSDGILGIEEWEDSVITFVAYQHRPLYH